MQKGFSENNFNKCLLILMFLKFVMAYENCAVCKGHGMIELLDSQCSLCGKRCHHDTLNKPKILLNPE